MLPLECPLRFSSMPGEIHEGLAVSAPLFFELVSIPDAGLECVRGYYAVTGRCFYSRYSRLRTHTLIGWERLTGERLTSDLKSVARRTA